MNQLWDANLASGQQDPELKLTAPTFNLVINEIARSCEPKCANRATALLTGLDGRFIFGRR
jgi:hypothetical protein